MRTSLLLLPMLLLSIFPVRAQHVTQDESAATRPVFITLVVNGVITSEDGAEVLPLPILERLTQESALATLNVHEKGRQGRQGILEYQAQFRFTGMQALSHWYNSESTQALLRDLKAEGDGGIQIALNMSRTLSKAPAN